MATDQVIFDPRLVRLARLVQKLRAVQKSGGSGYKSAAISTEAAALEKQVDAEITQVLGGYRITEPSK